MLSMQQILRLVRKVFSGFWDDELFTRAAALAFYSAFSFAPPAPTPDSRTQNSSPP